MATKEIVSKSKLDALANSILNKSGGSTALTIDQMKTAVDNLVIASDIHLQSKTVTPTTSTQNVTADAGYDALSGVTVNAIPSQYIVPSGSLSITSNDSYNVTQYASVDVNVPTGSTINNQNKTVTPTESEQIVTADSGYTGLGTVTVDPIDSTYVGSQVARKDASDLIVSRATVTTPAGYYASGASKTVASGSATIDLTLTTVTPTITVSSSGLITATNNSAVTGVQPTITEGYITTGTSGRVDIAGSNTKQLATQAGMVATPTESEQTIVAADTYTTGAIKVGAISSTYVGSGIARRDQTDLTASGNTVTVPAGLYSEQETKSIANGSAGTPTATKGTVSNHRVTVTPSVTNTTGYITGGTISGTGVTVNASELVSGNKAISENGSNIDVTNYATVSVDVPVGDTINNQSKSVTPTESEQEITYDSGYTGLETVTVGAISDTYVGSEVSRQGGTTVGPTEHDQNIVAANTYVTGLIKVSGIPSTYVGTEVARKSSSDLTASGATITAPAGYYSEAASKSVTTMTLPTSASSSATSGYTSKATIGRSTSDQYINISPGYNSSGGYYKVSAVANGSVTAPSSISGTAATVSTETNTLTLTKSVSVTPNVTTAGYISSGTAGNASISLSANVTTKAAATITPGTSNQTIASGTYLTGTQTISGDADLVAGNIKTGTSIFNVTGTYTSDATAAATDILQGETAYVNGNKITGTLVTQTYYTGSSTPASSLGNNGDIYLKVVN